MEAAVEEAVEEVGEHRNYLKAMEMALEDGCVGVAEE